MPRYTSSLTIYTSNTQTNVGCPLKRLSSFAISFFFFFFIKSCPSTDFPCCHLVHVDLLAEPLMLH